MTVTEACPPALASARPETDAVPLRTWIAVVGAALGAFLAILNIQIGRAHV